MEKITGLWVCVDCAQVVANGDWSEIDDERREEISQGLDLEPGTWVLDGLGDESETATIESGYKVFSRASCDCCKSYLGGARLSAALI